jgi:hypothetical protein
VRNFGCIFFKIGLSLLCVSAFGVSIVVATDLKMQLDVFETFFFQSTLTQMSCVIFRRRAHLLVRVGPFPIMNASMQPLWDKLRRGSIMRSSFISKIYETMYICLFSLALSTCHTHQDPS